MSQVSLQIKVVLALALLAGAAYLLNQNHEQGQQLERADQLASTLAANLEQEKRNVFDLANQRGADMVSMLAAQAELQRKLAEQNQLYSDIAQALSNDSCAAQPLPADVIRMRNRTATNSN